MKSVTRIHVLSATLFLILSFLLSANSAFAETKTFIKEYTHHAGDEDSRNSSRIISLREVKRLILEELGTYLESHTEVKNFQLTKDMITTLTAGIVSTEVIEDKWNGKEYWLKAKITANPQDVMKAIDNLRNDRVKVKELDELRIKTEELLKENERLNKELKTAKGDAKQEAAQAYNRNIDNLNATEWYEKGYGLGISGNNTDAEKAFSKAIELNPQYAHAYYNRGTIYGRIGNYQPAIKDFSKAIELNPPRLAEVYYNRGVAYGKIGNYQQAIKDFSKAIELNPQYADAYNNRGVAYGKIGNTQHAITDYNTAIVLNPQDAMFYFNRGIMYGKIGNTQQEIKDYNKAIELNPQDAEVYFNRGVTYGGIGNYQQAINDYSKAIELNPQYASAYHNRGVAFHQLGNDERAIENVKIAARLGDNIAQDLLRSKGIDW